MPPYFMCTSVQSLDCAPVAAFIWMSSTFPLSGTSFLHLFNILHSVGFIVMLVLINLLSYATFKLLYFPSNVAKQQM